MKFNYTENAVKKYIILNDFILLNFRWNKVKFFRGGYYE